MSTDQSQYVYAIPLSKVREKGCQVVHLNGHTVALFAHGDRVYAIDNRCPHMGFPLDKGSIREGILTCHWHHARFDLESGGTFDQFADDVRAFAVEIRQGEIWVDLAQQADERQRQQERLQVGLERDIPLVIGKAALVLLADQGDPVAPFRAGLDFGTRYRRGGWQQGLTMLTCFMNMLPRLTDADRPRALYHGLSAVAAESFGQPPRFAVRPLPATQSASASITTLKRWFRQFIEVRDDEGAERCVVSAIQAGASPVQLADMLFAAVTDHRYIDIGHPADFTNKAFEALDIAGWEYAEPVLTSLVRGYARASRMEESNAWRHPIDLIAILQHTFTQLPDAVVQGQGRHQTGSAEMRDELVTVLLDDDPQASADALLAAAHLHLCQCH
jgi:nitrite reductase/ring-hydroxylating ferredoxin subunit